MSKQNKLLGLKKMIGKGYKGLSSELKFTEFKSKF